jgi:putative phosphoesterase
MVKKFDFKDSCLIGVISDTHGYLSAGAFKAFANIDLIIHAGDIGKPEILKFLKSMAPLIAVRGNMDFGHWANQLPQDEIVQIGTVIIYVVHDVHRRPLVSNSAGINVIISGHTHRPEAEQRDGIYFINPGSASHPKFGGTASVALLRLQGNDLIPEFIQLTN